MVVCDPCKTRKHENCQTLRWVSLSKDQEQLHFAPSWCDCQHLSDPQPRDERLSNPGDC